MAEFTSVSGSDRAIMDITLTVTTIRTDPIDRTTGRTTGIADIDIIAIIIPIIIAASLIRIATPGWLEVNSGQPNSFQPELAEKSRTAKEASGLFS
jgi:hypothetical protein